MRHCGSCGVSVTGDGERCPLCRNLLSGTPSPETEVFPKLPPTRYRRHLLYKLTTAAAVTAVVVCVAINWMFPGPGWWSILAAAGIFSGWFVMMVGISQRRNLVKNVTWQLFIVSALTILLDLLSNWHGWSVDYVLPCLCVFSMGALITLAMVMHLPPNEYLFNLTLAGIYSLLPAVLLLTDKVSVAYPSVISAACGVILLAFIWIFSGRKAGKELTKKFHLR